MGCSQASLSMGFSRQEYWSGLPCLPARDLPNSGTKPESLRSPALAGSSFTTGMTREAPTSQLSLLSLQGDIKNLSLIKF